MTHVKSLDYLPLTTNLCTDVVIKWLGSLGNASDRALTVHSMFGTKWEKSVQRGDYPRRVEFGQTRQTRLPERFTAQHNTRVVAIYTSIISPVSHTAIWETATKIVMGSVEVTLQMWRGLLNTRTDELCQLVWISIKIHFWLLYLLELQFFVAVQIIIYDNRYEKTKFCCRYLSSISVKLYQLNRKTESLQLET